MERRRYFKSLGQICGFANLRKTLIAVAISCAVGLRAGDGLANPAHIAGYYQDRVVKIVFIGTRFDGGTEINSGSGLLLGNSLVVTSNHVIGRAANYKSSQIAVKFFDDGSGSVPVPKAASLSARDVENDLAVLQLSQPVDTSPRCPLFGTPDASKVARGEAIVILGYPLTLDQQVVPGWVEGKQDEKGRWTTNAAANYGLSGSPVFLDDGSIVGFITSTITKWVTDDNVERPVQDISYFISSKALTSGPLAPTVTASPACWSADGLSAAAPAVTPSTSSLIASLPVKEFNKISQSALDAASNRAANALAQAPDAHLTVVGKGPSNENLALVTRQAESIKDLLIAKGVPQTKIFTGSYGKFTATQSPLNYVDILLDVPTVTAEAKTMSDAKAALQSSLKGTKESLPQTLQVAYRVEFAKEDHPSLLLADSRTYSQDFNTEEGYTISECKWSPSSAAGHAAEKCDIATNGKTATFSVELKSGPIFDRYRAWWEGAISLTLKRL